MMDRRGVEARVHYDGLTRLSMPTSMDWSSIRSTAGTAARLARNRQVLRRFAAELRGMDLIVVVAAVPGSFSRGSLMNIESLRGMVPSVPIVNYDLHYLPTIDKWAAAMLRGEESGLTAQDMEWTARGSFGMERYDWYLMASVVSEIAMPPGPHPYTLIGIDINDGSLYPAQKGKVRALVDFAQNRKNYPSYRTMQIAALEQTGVPYEVLEHELSMSDIRALYRRTSIFLLASRESFGLPICELQACGSLIFSPHADWPGAHWIKEDLRVPGPGWHSPNFRIYNNCFDDLVGQIEEVQRSPDPAAVRRTFEEYHPQLLRGNTDALGGFLEMVQDGTIHSSLHQRHAGVGR